MLKCTPKDRRWPLKCDFCVSKNMPCSSPNLPTNRISERRSTSTSQTIINSTRTTAPENFWHTVLGINNVDEDFKRAFGNLCKTIAQRPAFRGSIDADDIRKIVDLALAGMAGSDPLQTRWSRQHELYKLEMPFIVQGVLRERQNMKTWSSEEIAGIIEESQHRMDLNVKPPSSSSTECQSKLQTMYPANDAQTDAPRSRKRPRTSYSNPSVNWREPFEGDAAVDMYMAKQEWPSNDSANKFRPDHSDELDCQLTAGLNLPQSSRHDDDDPRNNCLGYELESLPSASNPDPSSSLFLSCILHKPMYYDHQNVEKFIWGPLSSEDIPIFAFTDESVLIDHDNPDYGPWDPPIGKSLGSSNESYAEFKRSALAKSKSLFMGSIAEDCEIMNLGVWYDLTCDIPMFCNVA